MTFAESCLQAYAGGDVEYFRAAGCTQSSANDQLIAASKKALDTKTYLLIGGGIAATALIIYLSVRK